MLLPNVLRYQVDRLEHITFKYKHKQATSMPCAIKDIFPERPRVLRPWRTPWELDVYISIFALDGEAATAPDPAARASSGVSLTWRTF